MRDVLFWLFVLLLLPVAMWAGVVALFSLACGGIDYIDAAVNFYKDALGG